MMPGGLAHNGSVILHPFVQFMVLGDVIYAQWSGIRYPRKSQGGSNGETDEKSGIPQ